MAKAKGDVKNDSATKSVNPLKTVLAKITKPGRASGSPKKSVGKAAKSPSKHGSQTGKIQGKKKTRSAKIAKKLGAVRKSLTVGAKKRGNEKSLSGKSLRKSQSKTVPKFTSRAGIKTKTEDDSADPKSRGQISKSPVKTERVSPNDIKAELVSGETADDVCDTASTMPSQRTGPGSKVSCSKNASKKNVSRVLDLKTGMEETSSSDKKSVSQISEQKASVQGGGRKSAMQSRDKKSAAQSTDKKTPIQIADKKHETQIFDKMSAAQTPDKKSANQTSGKRSMSQNTDKKSASQTPDKRSVSQTPDKRSVSQNTDKKSTSQTPDKRSVSQTPDKRSVSQNTDKKSTSQTPDKRSLSPKKCANQTPNKRSVSQNTDKKSASHSSPEKASGQSPDRKAPTKTSPKRPVTPSQDKRSAVQTGDLKPDSMDQKAPVKSASVSRTKAAAVKSESETDQLGASPQRSDMKPIPTEWPETQTQPGGALKTSQTKSKVPTTESVQKTMRGKESKPVSVKASETQALDGPINETASPSKSSSTPLKKPKNVKVRSIRHQEDIKIIKQVTPKKARKNLRSITKDVAKTKPVSIPKSRTSGSPGDIMDNGSPQMKANLEKDTPKAGQSKGRKHEIDKKQDKSPKSNVTRLRTPKKSPTDVYKSRHNIGRRSAGRVCTYKETEIALLFPDDYQWSVSKLPVSGSRKSSLQSNKTASDYESDDSEISFAKPLKQNISKRETSKVDVKNRTPSSSPKRASSKDDCVPKSVKNVCKPKEATEPKSAKQSEKPSGRKTEESYSESDDLSSSKTAVKTRKTRKKAPKRKAANETSTESSSEDEEHERRAAGKTKAKVIRKRRRSKYEDIRPRAPRIQRTACLNANAINSILYATGGARQGGKAQRERATADAASPVREIEETKKREVKKSPAKSAMSKKEATKTSESKGKKRKALKRKQEEVDIPLWPPPKRMASLNAQAIMTAYKELEDMKPEKLPKPRKETTPKEKKSKARKSLEHVPKSNETAISFSDASAKSTTAKEKTGHGVARAHEPPTVRFVVTSGQGSPAGKGADEVHSPHEYINVVDDGEVSSHGRAAGMGSSFSSPGTSANTSGSSSDVTIIETPQRQELGQSQQAEFKQTGGESVRPKVPTPKPVPQYPPMQYPVNQQAPFAHGAGFQPLYQNQPIQTSHPSSVQQSNYQTTSQQYGAPTPPFEPPLMYPRHSSPYKQHPSVQNVPAYPPAPYNLAKPPFETTSRSPFESATKPAYESLAKSQYESTQSRYNVTSLGGAVSSTPVYTQAQKPVSVDTLSSGERPVQMGFQSVRPAAAATMPYTQTTASATQSGSCQPFPRASANVQNFPTGYPVMGYPRPAFGHQGAFVNPGYQVFPGQQSQTGSGNGSQGTQQNVGAQAAHAPTQNLFLNYGYYQPAGPLIHTVGPSPYMTMQLPHSKIKPFSQPIMAHTQPVFQPDSKSTTKPLAIAPKPNFLDTDKRSSQSTKSPQKSKTKADAIDLTKETGPVVRPTFPSVVVTSHVHLSTQVIPQNTTASSTTKTSPSKPSKPTKDIMDLDSKKVKVHTGAVGEMERNSPLKIPRGLKSTTTGVPPKKAKLDGSSSKLAAKPAKMDKTQAATVTSVSVYTGVTVTHTTSAAVPAVTSPSATVVAAGKAQTAQPLGAHPTPPLVRMPVMSLPGVSPLVGLNFQARHVLPGQITMPRGPYHTKPLAARAGGPFSIPNITKPDAISPPKAAQVQRKRPSQGEKPSKAKADSVKKTIMDSPMHKVKTASKSGMMEQTKVQLSSKSGKGSKSEQTTPQQSSQVSPQNKTKTGRNSSPSVKGRVEDRKLAKKETPNKASLKSPKASELKFRMDVEKHKHDLSRQKPELQQRPSKPNSPRQKTDPSKVTKTDTVKLKGDSSRKADSPRQRPETPKARVDSPKQKIELKVRKDDLRASPSNLKTSPLSGSKKERKRSLDERRFSPGSGGRRRLQSAPLQAPPTSWQWEGQPELKNNHFVQGEMSPVLRKCYPGIRHSDGDVIRVRDCVLVKSGSRRKDIPFVAKIAALWDFNGEMMMNIFWYYRPEQTDTDRLPKTEENEIFASRHRDVVPVACIDDKAYVLTFSEFCRYKTEQKRIREGLPPRAGVVPSPEDDQGPMPPLNAPAETVFLCRKVYDVKLRRFLKNPQVNNCHSPMSSKAHSISSKSPSPKAPTPPDSMDSTSSPYHTRSSGSDSRGRQLQLSTAGREGQITSPMSPDGEVFVLHSANLPSFVPKGHVSVLKHDTAVAPLDIVLPSDPFLERQTSGDYTSKESPPGAESVDKKPSERSLCFPSDIASSGSTVISQPDDNARQAISAPSVAVEESPVVNSESNVGSHPRETPPETCTKDTAHNKPSTPNGGVKRLSTLAARSAIDASKVAHPVAASRRKAHSYAFVAKDAKSKATPGASQLPTSFAHSPESAPFETYKFVARRNSSDVKINEVSGANVSKEQTVETQSENGEVPTPEVTPSDATSSAKRGRGETESQAPGPDCKESENGLDLESGDISAAKSLESAELVDNSSCGENVAIKPASENVEDRGVKIGTPDAKPSGGNERGIDSKIRSKEVPAAAVVIASPVKGHTGTDLSTDSDRTIGTGSPSKARRADVDLNTSVDSDKTIDTANLSLFEALNTSSSTDDSECREGEEEPEEVITDMTIVEDGSEKRVILGKNQAKIEGQEKDPDGRALRRDLITKGADGSGTEKSVPDPVARVEGQTECSVGPNVNNSNSKDTEVKLGGFNECQEGSEANKGSAKGGKPVELSPGLSDVAQEGERIGVETAEGSSSITDAVPSRMCGELHGVVSKEKQSKREGHTAILKTTSSSEQAPSPIPHTVSQSKDPGLLTAGDSGKVGLSFPKASATVLPPFETLRTLGTTRAVSIPKSLDAKPVARSSPVSVDCHKVTKGDDTTGTMATADEGTEAKGNAPATSQSSPGAKASETGPQECAATSPVGQSPSAVGMSRIEQIVSQIKKSGSAASSGSATGTR